MTVNTECVRCGATGLVDRKDGHGTICSACGGSGCITLNTFSARRPVLDVNRVYANKVSYLKPEDGEGTLYSEWLAGGGAKQIQDVYCPLQWCAEISQADTRKNILYLARCSEQADTRKNILYLARCSEQADTNKCACDKKKCWEIYNAL